MVADRRICSALATLGTLAFAMAVAAPVEAQDFYKGKTLTIVIGNTAGSGYDLYGRIISRYMAKHLPGQPNVVAQNMPGALGVKATDYLVNIAAHDGTVIAHVNPNALTDPLVARDPALHRYDPTKIEFIGTADSGTKVCFSRRDSNVKTFDDVLKAEAVLATTLPAPYPYLLNAIAGAIFKIVAGYPGPAEFIMAVERGEADVICPIDLNALNSMRPGLVGSDKVNMLLQIGLEPNPSLTAMGVPEIWKYIDPAERPVVELLVGEVVVQRPFIAPPGTPPAQLQALRAAFDAAIKDPEMLADAKKANIEINPKSGAEVEAQIRKMYSASPAQIERIGRLTRPWQ